MENILRGSTATFFLIYQPLFDHDEKWPFQGEPPWSRQLVRAVVFNIFPFSLIPLTTQYILCSTKNKLLSSRSNNYTNYPGPKSDGHERAPSTKGQKEIPSRLSLGVWGGLRSGRGGTAAQNDIFLEEVKETKVKTPAAHCRGHSWLYSLYPILYCLGLSSISFPEHTLMKLSLVLIDILF